MPFHVFLSHSSADKLAVEELARRLVKEGIQAWLDKWHLIPGNPWQPDIEMALAESETCAVFVGPSGFGPWQNEEMRAAIDQRVRDSGRRFRVIPVLLPGAKRAERSSLPVFLAATTWVEFPDSLDDSAAFHRLVCGIRGLEPGAGPGQAIYEGQCPYRGLRVFDVDDAPFFFGREAFVQWLLNELRPATEGQPVNRFLAIVGSSGSGKSSVARAGLVAALKRDAIPGGALWPVAICRPGPDPLESLAVALSRAASVAQSAPALAELIAEFQKNEKTLHLIARQSLPENAPDMRMVIVVDQFEEVFTLCRKQELREALIRNLLYAAKVAQGRTLVIVTMRADFYGKCAANAELAAAFSDHHVLVGPMMEEELRRVIEKPTHLVGCELEAGLVDLLVQDVHRQPGALPLLQHALLELWNKREGRRLTVKVYQEIGKLEGALQRRADATLKSFSQDEQELCRRTFLRLTQPGEGTEDTKRRASMQELLSLSGKSTAEGDIIQKLADASLLTTEGDLTQRDAFVEVAHEALIRGWPQLRKWIDADRAGLRTRIRLTEATRDWKNAGRDPAYLYTAARLAVAKEWEASHPDQLSTDETEFLTRSLEAQSKREASELEAAQHLTLTEAARAAEAEKRQRAEAQRAEEAEKNRRLQKERAENAEKRAKEQKEAASKLRRLALMLALVALAAAASAIFGFWQKGEAVRQKIEAKNEADLAVKAERTTNEAASQANVSLARNWQPGENDKSLAYLAKALRLNAGNFEAGALAAALLTQESWPVVTGAMKHDDAVTSAQFSPDGQRVVTASRDKTARVWDATTGKALGEPMKHDAAVYSAQFSPDGQRVVTASEDNTARVWDAATGKALGEPMKHDDAVTSARFSPDGQRVVTAFRDNTARVWDAATGKALGEPMKHDAFVTSAQFSPDRQRVVTASRDKTARVWDATTGKALGEPMKHDDVVYSAQFSPDGQRVLTASEDKTARVWDATTGKALGEPMKHDDAVTSAQFSPDGQRMVTASRDKTARVWDAATGKALGEPMKHDDAVTSAQFSLDGQRVVTASRDKTARVWDATTGKALGEPMKHDDAVTSACFSPDGQRVVTASRDKTARVWDAAAGKALGEPMKHDALVTSARFSPDGQRVVTASWDKTARVWDATTGKALGEPMKHDAFVTSARFSPDGQRVVTASRDKTARVWDAATGEALGEPMKHDDVVTSAQFSPDGQRVVTASYDQTARVWDAATGKALGEPMKYDDAVTSAQFSPDGQRVVTPWDSTARVWDATTGKALGEPMKHDDAVTSAQFSPDGQRVVTASYDQTARVWDAATGKALGEPMRHDDAVTSAQFSPDGQRVVTASIDKTARVWDATTGKALGEPMKHDDVVDSAQFSPDGQRVVTASWDKTARVWDATTGKALGEPMKHDAAVYSAQFSPDGQRVVTASTETARVWDIPTITTKDSADDVNLLADLAEAIGGLALQPFGQTEILAALTLDQVKATRDKIAVKFPGPPSQLTQLQRFLKWSVSDRRQRTISPFSELTVPEWIENRIKEGTLESLRAAIQMDPANARLIAHFGFALANLAVAEETNPDVARRALAEADYQTRRALRLDPDNDEVRKLRDEVVKVQNIEPKNHPRKN